MAGKKFNALPGFGLTLGFTMFYLSVIVLIPLAGLFFRVSEAGWRSQDFYSHDFRDVTGLVEKVKEHADPVSQLIWNTVPEPARPTLSNFNPDSETANEA